MIYLQVILDQQRREFWLMLALLVSLSSLHLPTANTRPHTHVFDSPNKQNYLEIYLDTFVHRHTRIERENSVRWGTRINNNSNNNKQKTNDVNHHDIKRTGANFIYMQLFLSCFLSLFIIYLSIYLSIYLF